MATSGGLQQLRPCRRPSSVSDQERVPQRLAERRLESSGLKDLNWATPSFGRLLSSLCRLLSREAKSQVQLLTVELPRGALPSPTELTQQCIDYQLGCFFSERQ